MARLWRKVNGEPYMINPRLGFLGLNPKKGKTMAAKKRKGHGASHMAWVRSFRKKGRSRKRNYAVAGPVTSVMNPRRRRRRNPVAVQRRSWRRRSSGGADQGMRVGPFTLPPLGSVLYAGVGFVAPPLLESKLGSFLPLSFTSTTLGRYTIKVGTVLGLTWMAQQVLGPQAAKMVAVGGGAYVLVSAVREFAPTMIPSMAAYAPAARLGAYAPARRQLAGMGAQPSPFGGASERVVAARFRRFQ